MKQDTYWFADGNNDTSWDAVYVVWQQGREDVASQGGFDGRRDFGRVFGLPASNVFLVKASYWFNF